MKPAITVLILLALGLLDSPVLPAAEPAGDEAAAVDYGAIPRRIAKEPEYVGEPLYALFLFGPAGDVRMWAVLDRSSADLAYRDVLYLDKDADGDLTEEGERFTGRYQERLARAGMGLTIRVGDLPVPGTDRVHGDMIVTTIPKEGRKGIWCRLKWCGEETVSGGAPSGGYDSTIWGATPETAPVLRPTAEGPLAFAIWGTTVFRIGQENRVSLMAGNPGSGPDTLFYVDDKFFDPAKDRIVAVLRAKNREGEDVEIPLEMQAPC